MNSFRASTFIYFGVALILSAASVAKSDESSLNGITMKVCSPTKCLELRSLHAWGSQIKSMFVMKNIELTVIDLKTKAQKTTFGTTGRFDFQTNEVVISESNQGKIIDRVFNLNTLEETRILVN